MGVSESGYSILRRPPKPDVELAWIVWNGAFLCVATHTLDRGSDSRATAFRPSTPNAGGTCAGSWRRQSRQVHESCSRGIYTSHAPYGIRVHTRGLRRPTNSRDGHAQRTHVSASLGAIPQDPNS